MSTRLPIVTGKLWTDVDQLTRAHRHRLVRKVRGSSAGIVEHINVPSLWDQLTAVRGSTITSDGAAAKSTGSAAPLNLVATALMMEMTSKVLAGLALAGLTPRWLVLDPGPPVAAGGVVLERRRPRLDDDGRPLDLGAPVVDPQLAGLLVERSHAAAARRAARIGSGRRKHDTASDLRRLLDHLTTDDRADQVEVDRWARLVHRWVQMAEDALALDDPDADDQVGIRGRACPTCAAIWAVHYRDEDPDTYWQPALVATMHERRVRAVSCRVCGELWWRGEGLQLEHDQDAPRAAGPVGPVTRADHDDAERRRLSRLLHIPTERVLP